jgi:divalent metal cation (Fe/Co/Zn/Cd) transporter
MESKVRAIAANQRGIIGLDKCHVRKMGLSFYVDFHIVVDGQAGALSCWNV